jgi:hypothetical protein
MVEQGAGGPTLALGGGGGGGVTGSQGFSFISNGK